MIRLFISDLHLHSDRPQVAEGLNNFLNTHAHRADALYILGDLFDSWIGDDYCLPLYQQIIDSLAQVGKSKVALYFMHGNRDFLIREEFSRHTACQIINDPHTITGHAQDVLLTHGDILCTKDITHKILIAITRRRRWIKNILVNSFLAQPIRRRLQILQAVKRINVKFKKNKSLEIMDVVPKTVQQVMETHRTSIMIHGHTHRPAIHRLATNGEPQYRIVLGDWDEYGWYVQWDDQLSGIDAFQLQKFKI